MSDISTFERISTARLEQWGVREGGFICVRLKGGRQEVRLTPRQWGALLDRYHDKVDPSARRLRLAMILTIPFGIFLLVLFANVPLLDRFGDWMDRGPVPWLLPLLVTSGLPIAAIAHHAWTIQRAVDRAQSGLARYERFPARDRSPPRDATPLEKAAAITMGPYLLVQIYGTIDPNAYRNTPWTGTRLDLVSLFCVALLCGLGFRRWRAVRLARADQRPEKEARAVDALARARNTPS